MHYLVSNLVQVDHTSNLDSSISDINIYSSLSLNGDITDNLQYQIWVGEDYEGPSNYDTNIFDVVNVTLVSDEVSMSVHMSIYQVEDINSLMVSNDTNVVYLRVCYNSCNYL